jgi:MFS family permease
MADVQADNKKPAAAGGAPRAFIITLLGFLNAIAGLFLIAGAIWLGDMLLGLVNPRDVLGKILCNNILVRHALFVAAPLGAIAGVLLLISSFGLLKLKHWAYKLSLVYAVGSIAIFALSSIFLLSNSEKLFKRSDGTTKAVFHVNLSQPNVTDTTVAFSTADGTAVAGSDYVAAQGTVTIPVGRTNGVVQVFVNGDSLIEADETFSLNLSNASNAVISSDRALATIVDDDRAPLVTVSNVIVKEGDVGAVKAVFDVELSHPSLVSNVTVSFATTDGSAVAGADYEAAQGMLTIPAGLTRGKVVVGVNGDRENEGNLETFHLNLSNAVNATLATPGAMGTITDDDKKAQLFVKKISVLEGNDDATRAVFAVILSRPVASNVTVSFATADGTAVAGTDYMATNGTLTFAPGRTAAEVPVQVNGDWVDEGMSETFSLNLSDAVNAAIGNAQAKANIIDNDGVRDLSIADAGVQEGTQGITQALFRVSLSHPGALSTTVMFATSNGTATAGSDYVATTGTLTIPAGRTNGVIAVRVKGDEAKEGAGETFHISLSNAVNAVVVNSNAVGTIIDDDGVLSLSIKDATMMEGTQGTTQAVFAVTLGRPCASTVTVDFATADGTAVADADYTPMCGTLVIPPGQTNSVIIVTVNGDWEDEWPSEYFYLNLSNAVNAVVLQAQGRATIVDDDRKPGVMVGDITVREGDNADKPEVAALAKIMKTGLYVVVGVGLIYPVLILLFMMRRRVMDMFKVDLSETFHCGSILYTKMGLTALFAWLLWGDFCFTLFEGVVPSVLPLKLKALGASNTIMMFVMVTLPSILNMTVVPWISFKSDRYRSRWGRRLPFILWTMPFVTVSLILLGYSESIAVALRGWIPILQAVAPNTLIIGMIAFFLVVFQFFNMFVNSLFWYLFNDVVPPQFLARFMGLFRIVGTAAGAIYQGFFFKYAESNMREIMVGGALLYFVGFGLMCVFVKEGKYPPPPEETTFKRKNIFADVITFGKESFSTRFYWYFYLSGAISRICYSLGMFNIFFSKQMGLTLDMIGKMSMVGGIAGLCATYFMAVLVDRWHPMRIVVYTSVFTALTGFGGFIWVFVTLPPQLYFWLGMGGALLGVFGYTLQDTAGMPLMMRLLPKSRYGQFSSASAIVRSLAAIVGGLVASGYMDLLKWWCHGDDYAYRLMWTWTWPFQIINMFMMVAIYREWKRLGGDESYQPPAPWDPRGYEEVLDHVKSAPLRPRAMMPVLYLRLVGILVNIAFMIVFTVMMQRSELFLAVWWSKVVFIPITCVLTAMTGWQMFSVWRDIRMVETGRRPRYGVPHHGVFLVQAIQGLLFFPIGWFQTVWLIRIGMERELILFGVSGVMSTIASLGILQVIRWMEQEPKPRTHHGAAHGTASVQG